MITKASPKSEAICQNRSGKQNGAMALEAAGGTEEETEDDVQPWQNMARREHDRRRHIRAAPGRREVSAGVGRSRAIRQGETTLHTEAWHGALPSASATSAESLGDAARCRIDTKR
jgi:hypothetical protein